MKKAGFDITRFSSPEVWQSILSKFDAKYAGRTKVDYLGEKDIDNAFIWTGKDITVYTQNNPITGEYWNTKMRECDPGFASYIGVEGNKSAVEAFCKLVIRLADYYKEYDPNNRSFI